MGDDGERFVVEAVQQRHFDQTVFDCDLFDDDAIADMHGCLWLGCSLVVDYGNDQVKDTVPAECSMMCVTRSSSPSLSRSALGDPIL